MTFRFLNSFKTSSLTTLGVLTTKCLPKPNNAVT